MAQQDTRTLAGGCFGKVYREKYKDQWACIKRVPIGLIRMADLERECKVYRNAQHLNVVKLLGDPWLKESKWNIPLEFITGEELETTIFCSQKSKIKLTSTVRGTIISGMCAGLFHLHSKDIVHQDIKPDNIMVEHETNRPVIIDLGLAKFFKDGKTSAINVGNEAYSAPEILLWQGVRDKRSDVWAMGKVIAELCARVRLPTHAVTPSKIQETLAAHPYSVAVSKMVDSNPDTRIPMALVMADIKRAEGKVREEEARAREAASAHPGLKAGVGLAGVANDKTGLHQRGGLNVPSPAEVRRSPSPVTSRFQPSPQQVKKEVKTAVEVNPGTGARFGGAVGLQPRAPQQTPLPWVVPEKKWSPPVTVIQRNPPKREEIQTLVPVKTEPSDGVTQLLQQMTPFPCNIPKTGRVQHSHYVYDSRSGGGVLETKEVVTENGKITKYEGFKVNME
ncbi:hypothetical protein AALO_G00181520 [Alosa alosa]|uniref:Protein kinase domain-containing protein n=1 Tax=Alosa alosa TaxID=278164 RepID=A0AAV6GAK1_9TELE|nr:hypothetical protein AALO_G00181520 [Alosa alosa]